MQVYTGEAELVEVTGRNVRQLIAELEKLHPGLQDALTSGDKLRPDVTIMIDGSISRLGLLQPVRAENEIIFLPAISGG